MDIVKASWFALVDFLGSGGLLLAPAAVCAGIGAVVWVIHEVVAPGWTVAGGPWEVAAKALGQHDALFMLAGIFVVASVIHASLYTTVKKLLLPSMSQHVADGFVSIGNAIRDALGVLDQEQRARALDHLLSTRAGLTDADLCRLGAKLYRHRYLPDNQASDDEDWKYYEFVVQKFLDNGYIHEPIFRGRYHMHVTLEELSEAEQMKKL